MKNDPDNEVACLTLFLLGTMTLVLWFVFFYALLTLHPIASSKVGPSPEPGPLGYALKWTTVGLGVLIGLGCVLALFKASRPLEYCNFAIIGSLASCPVVHLLLFN